MLFNSLIAFLLLACSAKETNQTEASSKPNSGAIQLSKKQVLTLGIQLGKLEQRALGLSVFANGMIDVPPQNKSYVAMPFGGYIKKINVLDGMVVNKGQVLMVVEHPEVIQLQQEFLECQGQQEFLAADFERQKDLYEKEAGSAKNYQQAKSAYLVNKARLSGLSYKLEMANVNLATLRNGQIERTQQIRSPFTGVITKVTANVGAFAEPKDNLMEIIDLKHAHAELTVYEKYLTYLKKDQLVQLQFVDQQTTATAKVFLIGRQISNERTVKVHCHFEQLPKDIVPGAYLKAEIRADNQMHYTLPEEAIVRLNGKDVVFIQKGSNFLPVQVDILMSQDGYVAISSAQLRLLQNAQIVCKGAYELLAIQNKASE